LPQPFRIQRSSQMEPSMNRYTIFFLLLAAGATTAVIGWFDPAYLADYADVGMVVSRAILIVGVVLSVSLWRHLRAAAESEVADLVRSERPRREAEPGDQAINQWTPTYYGRADAPAADIEVCDSMSEIDEAKLLLGFGRWQEAGAALAAVAPKPAESVGYQISRINRGMALGAERVGRESVLPAFNVAWTPPGGKDASGQSLESFPHVMAAVQKHWGRYACAVYLDFLLLDTRGGTRTGFPVAVAEDIVMLRRVLEERLHLEPVGKSAQAGTHDSAPNTVFSWELRCLA